MAVKVNDDWKNMTSHGFTTCVRVVQALESAKEAIGKFEGQGIPWRRPPDFYAEMVKRDDHMAKVKEQLLFEQRQLEQADERCKAHTHTHTLPPLSWICKRGCQYRLWQLHI